MSCKPIKPLSELKNKYYVRKFLGIMGSNQGRKRKRQQLTALMRRYRLDMRSRVAHIAFVKEAWRHEAIDKAIETAHQKP